MDAVRLPSWKCWRETWRAGTAASRERLGTGHRGGCSGVSGCIGMRAPAEIEKVTFDKIGRASCRERVSSPV